MFDAMNRMTMASERRDINLSLLPSSKWRGQGERFSSNFRWLLLPALLLFLSLPCARAADKKTLVPGDPPLTQDMVDDYAKYLEWRLGPAIARAGGTARLAEMIIADWKNGDLKSRLVILAELKWWREEFPKLSKEDRDRLAAKNAANLREVERLRQASLAEMIQMLRLQQAFDARQQQIQAISNITARGHELNMQIIRNMGPTYRYEYNPATGRYDRPVPR